MYWQASTANGSLAPVDPFGHLLAYTDGNNVSTIDNYDAATGAITGISTGIGPSNSSVQQLAYSWGAFGNLQQRCDANRGLVEQFTYDGLNRLSTSAVTTAVGSCPDPTTTPTGTAGAAIGVTYDAIGNIRTLSNSLNPAVGGTYAYNDPAHPQAVTGVTNIPGTNTYDANGNLICRFGTWDGTNCTGGTGITWNSDNLPTQISGPTGSSTFSYGPDMQRYQQTATGSSGTTTTTYVGTLFEVVSTSSTTQYRHNIMAGRQVVAVHTLDQSGNETTSYVHSDHLGSTDTITNDQGAVTQQMSFDVFGLRRDSANWAYDLTSTQIAGLKSATDHGYTAQEQLDNVGLVHMNGRVYDPSIGMMISADPRIQDMSNGLAFNRYSYVYGNPLNATDPSGFDGQPQAGQTCTYIDGCSIPGGGAACGWLGCNFNLFLPSDSNSSNDSDTSSTNSSNSDTNLSDGGYTLFTSGGDTFNIDNNVASFASPIQVNAQSIEMNNPEFALFNVQLTAGPGDLGLPDPMSNLQGPNGPSNSKPSPRPNPGPNKPKQSGCSAVLPNGSTVGSVVNDVSNQINNSAQLVSTPYGPVMQNGGDIVQSDGSLASVVSTVYNGTNFRKQFGGPGANYVFLGNTGNFAYGAVSANIGVPLPVAEAVAGAYAALTHPLSDLVGPFGMDPSATVNVPAGYSEKCQ